MPFKSQAQRRKFAKMLVDGDISPETSKTVRTKTSKTVRKRTAKKTRRS